MRFYKYHALGNDMVVIDPASFDLPLTRERIRLMCDRHFGLGADGICYGPLLDAEHPRAMRFFNPDGSEAEKSGNGLRIFARYLWDHGYVREREFDLVIRGERIGVTVHDEAAGVLSVVMGRLTFRARAVPVIGFSGEVVDERLRIDGREYLATAVSIGNPHCVIFEHEVSKEVACAFGPLIENAAIFPNRTNVQFARVLDRHTLEIEIWERGVGYTLASGTSSCAAAGAAVRTGRCESPVEVRMAGGRVQVDIADDWRVTLTGSVNAVAEGTFAPELFAH